MSTLKISLGKKKKRLPNSGSFVKTINPYDIIDRQFDKLHVDKLDSQRGRHYYYQCTCDCGNVVFKRRSSLLHPEGKHISCGCHVYEEATKDIIGNKYNKLTVLEFDHAELNSSNRHNFFFKCKCDCGNECIVEKRSLVNGLTKSCGCLKEKMYGMSNTRIARIYGAMIDRCYNPLNTSYSNYGGRGIQVCDSWKEDFMNFYNDMNQSYTEHCEKYGEKNTTIERKNVNGNYCPENCVWATLEEQANNKRRQRYVNYCGEVITLAQAVKNYSNPSLDYHTVKHRLNNGWSLYVALNYVSEDGKRANLRRPIRFK